MRKVPVEKIEPDMILGRDVSSTSGNVLLGKGIALTPAIGRRLKNWGIFFVYVDGEEESQQQEATMNASPEETKMQMQKKFDGVMDNPIMKKIFDAVFDFKVNKRSS